jgi:hypothetical protein
VEETFRHRLDIYYISAIVYVVTFVVYAMVQGTLISDGSFEMIWRDPILYLLVACSALSLVALLVVAFSRKRVVVANKELRFETRFRRRIFTPEEVAWIGFRPERQFRGEQVYPIIRIKLQGRRRLLRLRPGGFERSGELASVITNWAKENNVDLRMRRRRIRRKLRP